MRDFLEQQKQEWLNEAGEDLALSRALRSGTWDALEEATHLLQVTSKAKYFQVLGRREVESRCGIDCPMHTALSFQGKYLHANLVSYSPLAKSFIATQYPYDSFAARELFWNIACQHGMIVDLTRKTEGLLPYYPEAIGKELSYGNLTIQCVDMHLHHPDMSSYFYAVMNAATSSITEMQRIHFSSWLDHGVTSLDKLVFLVDHLKQSSNEKSMTIHCQAGIGRTGTLITAFFLRETIVQGWITEENLANQLVLLILFLRLQRAPYFVQTQSQFQLLMDYGRLQLAKG